VRAAALPIVWGLALPPAHLTVRHWWEFALYLVPILIVGGSILVSTMRQRTAARRRARESGRS
jgi:hypothetical protein